MIFFGLTLYFVGQFYFMFRMSGGIKGGTKSERLRKQREEEEMRKKLLEEGQLVEGKPLPR